ncbi:type II CAAX endopeptidase family protein [Lactobacillus sp. ESL0791]|uniref:type II CAAX endopeptidase family protein n=1 Tax=Lactobacillus sp. ESL0791 TaxID=2983234 RepID=UPI0023F8953C|nr:type II CAAX endopeptidase family protein [Lactobacillus sp. ESL0791]MDF7639831.1 type II CAAX endopeptidase family protein [Lactobacillus sp. ESL0791]
MRQFLHYFWNIACMVVAFFAYSFLQSFYFYPQRIKLRLHLNTWEQAVLTALITVIILFLVFWLYKRQLAETNDWGFNRRPHWDGTRLIIAVIGVLLILLLNFVLSFFIVAGTGKTTSANQQALNQIAMQDNYMFKLMVAIIAPFCEETIFRGMFFNTFFTKNTKANKWLGIIVSGFLFAYLHDRAFSPYILVYWSMGCVLGWVYMSTKDLRYSMLTHMIYNSLGMIL